MHVFQRTSAFLLRIHLLNGFNTVRKQLPQKKAKSISPALVVGLTGLEPVTPRLSSACSNQLSYKPDHLSLSSLSLNLAYQTLFTVPGGAEETRTPDIVLAKHSLYHLSYSPPKIELCDRIIKP